MKSPSFKFVLPALILAIRALIIGLAYLASSLFQWDKSAPESALARWDAVYFRQIAAHGYTFEHEHAFLPVSLYISRYVARITGLTIGSSLVLISQVCSLLAAAVLTTALSICTTTKAERNPNREETRDGASASTKGSASGSSSDTANEVNRSMNFVAIAALIWLICPAGIFLLAGYTESLLMLETASVVALEVIETKSESDAVSIDNSSTRGAYRYGVFLRLLQLSLIVLASFTRSNGMMLFLVPVWPLVSRTLQKARFQHSNIGNQQKPQQNQQIRQRPQQQSQRRNEQRKQVDIRSKFELFIRFLRKLVSTGAHEAFRNLGLIVAVTASAALTLYLHYRRGIELCNRNFDITSSVTLLGKHSLPSRPWCNSKSPFRLYKWVQKTNWNVGFLQYWTLKNIPNIILALPTTAYSLFTAIAFLRAGREKLRNEKLLSNQAISALEALCIAQIILTTTCFFGMHAQIINRLSSGMPLIAVMTACFLVLNWHQRIAWVWIDFCIIWISCQAILFGSFLPPA